jgi:hypothetical protein
MNRSLDVRRIASWVGQQALSGIIGTVAWVVVVGVTAAALFLFRSTVSDFLEADVRVWHFIVVLLAVGLSAYCWRRWLAAGPEASTTVERRQYIPYRGVDWDRYGKAPRCPKDHAYLAWVPAEDMGPMPYTSELGTGTWPKLGDGRLNFVCLKCHATYDLNGGGDMTYLHSVIATFSEAPD